MENFILGKFQHHYILKQPKGTTKDFNYIWESLDKP